ncbi:MAG: hypothetical protein WCH57_12295 [Verrucomicrobiota bacterium]
MKRIFSLLVAVAGLAGMGSGCATTCHQWIAIPCETPYWQVVITDFEGSWISEYIAEGHVTQTCNGVCFQAMQRRIFRPITLTFRYPLGRPVKVQGSHIIITPTDKPLWLRQIGQCIPPPNQCSTVRHYLPPK